MSMVHGFKLTFVKTVERFVDHDVSNPREEGTEIEAFPDGLITSVVVERVGVDPVAGTYTLEMSGVEKVSITDALLPFSVYPVDLKYGPKREPLAIKQSWKP
jgi:hypothetical protein